MRCSRTPSTSSSGSGRSTARLPDWEQLYDGYVAAVDWPSVAFWRELADEYPDAMVLLTSRDADAWWRSVDSTIFVVARSDEAPDALGAAHLRMAKDMLTLRFTPDWNDERAAKAAYERHNDEVRATVAPDRLVEWRPGDGWEPICRALSVPVPDTPFPHVNTTEEFRANLGLA